jgi:hypothetical protein
LRLIDEMKAGRAPVPPAAAPARPATLRLEVERWREAFLCDAVADRLASICALLEERVDALEEELTAGPPRTAPAAGPPASGAPAAAASRTDARAVPPAAGEHALLSGQIQEGVLSDVLQMLSANQKSGRFVIEGPGGAMHLWYQEGEIRHATAGELAGEDAFFAAISQPSGAFYFVESTAPPPAQTINNKTQFLILEGLRKMDEEGLTGEPPQSGEHPA